MQQDNGTMAQVAPDVAKALHATEFKDLLFEVGEEFKCEGILLEIRAINWKGLVVEPKGEHKFKVGDRIDLKGGNFQITSIGAAGGFMKLRGLPGVRVHALTQKLVRKHTRAMRKK